MVDVCDRYIAAVAAGDVDAVLALYADDATIEDPVGTDPKHGKEELRAFYAANAGIELTMRRLGPATVVGNRAAFQFGIWVDLGDRKITMTSTDVMTFDDEGRITSMTAYPDFEADPDAG
jgi:steroid delta-isomerase